LRQEFEAGGNASGLTRQHRGFMPPRKKKQKGEPKKPPAKDGGEWTRLLASMHGYEPVEWIRLNIPAIDLAIGQGIPRGRFITVVGEPKTAKTAFVLTCCTAFQRAGGVVIYLDCEHKLDKDFAVKLGVDWSKVSYERPDNIQELGKILGRISETAPSKTPVLVVADGLAALPGSEELVDLLSDEGLPMTEGLHRAKGLTQAIRTTLLRLSKKNVTLLAINQLRIKINLFGPSGKEPTGGSHLKYSSALSLMFRAREKISKVGDRNLIVGEWIEIEVVKNTFAPPHRKIKVSFKYDTGFTPYSGFADFLIRYGRVMERTGFLVYKDRKFRKDEIGVIAGEMPELLAPITKCYETPEGAPVVEEAEAVVEQEKE